MVHSGNGASSCSSMGTAVVLGCSGTPARLHRSFLLGIRPDWSCHTGFKIFLIFPLGRPGNLVTLKMFRPWRGLWTGLLPYIVDQLWSSPLFLSLPSVASSPSLHGLQSFLSWSFSSGHPHDGRSAARVSLAAAGSERYSPLGNPGPPSPVSWQQSPHPTSDHHRHLQLLPALLWGDDG